MYSFWLPTSVCYVRNKVGCNKRVQDIENMLWKIDWSYAATFHPLKCLNQSVGILKWIKGAIGWLIWQPIFG